MGNSESCCSLSIPACFQLHPTALREGGVTAGMLSCPTEPMGGAVLPQDPALTLLLLTELLLELPCLALAVLHPLCSLPQQKHHIQVTLVIISSRKGFIWVYLRKKI